MKCVILAAGKGTRMGDLSIDTPKPLLKVLGKTLLEHTLDMLPEEINEVVMTVNHLKDKIINTLGSQYKNIKMTYVEQTELLGTAHALWTCKGHLLSEEKFIVMMGDNIYCKEDLEDCFSKSWSILVQQRETIKGVSKVVINKEGNIEDIIERYPEEEEGFTCAGVYTLSPEIFNYEMVQWGHGEYGLPQTILQAKKEREIKAVLAKFLLLVTTPEDIKMAETFLSIK